MFAKGPGIIAFVREPISFLDLSNFRLLGMGTTVSAAAAKFLHFTKHVAVRNVSNAKHTIK